MRKQTVILLLIMCTGCLLFEKQYTQNQIEYTTEIRVLEQEIQDLNKQLNDVTYERDIYENKIKELEEEKVVEQSKTTTTAMYKITHYSAEETGTSMTASGSIATPGYTIACNSLPLGTRVRINGNEYVVQDRVGVEGNVIDIYVNSTAEALSLGTYYTEVEILDD